MGSSNGIGPREVMNMMNPVCEIFNLIRSLLYAWEHHLIPSGEKICLSLSHLVPEILGDRIDVIFH